ncbi:MAG: hypothetical protein Q7O66_02040 [Dehalococcoidia bacterium]|nr:hypothetical protein [Dehalococcoidia bacterium]
MTTASLIAELEAKNAALKARLARLVKLVDMLVPQYDGTELRLACMSELLERVDAEHIERVDRIHRDWKKQCMDALAAALATPAEAKIDVELNNIGTMAKWQKE